MPLPNPIHAARRTLARTPLAPGRRFARWLELSERADLLRIGSDYGGWTVPEALIEPEWICYCAGVGDDISFDLGLIDRFGCEVFALDPTPAAARHVAGQRIADPRFHFLPVGLWSEDRMLDFYAPAEGDSNYSAVNLQRTRQKIEAPVKSLTTLMAELGHERLDLLKLDIEGAEYEALGPVLEGRVRPAVLLVEFHRTGSLAPVKSTVTRLRSQGYRPVARRGYDVTMVIRDLD